MSTVPGLREAVHNVLAFFFERRYCLSETKCDKPRGLGCLPESGEVAPQVPEGLTDRRAPVSFSRSGIVYRQRINSRLQISIVLNRREFQQFPLIAVVIVVIHPVINLSLDIVER